MLVRSITLLALIGGALGACNRFGDEASPAQQKTAAASSGSLTAEELAIEPPARTERDPVDAADASAVRIRMLSETGYENEHGEYVIDLLERDYAYVAAVLETPAGQRVRGAKPEFAVLTGSSEIVPVSEASVGGLTDDDGMLEFGVVGGRMGLDRISVRFGDAAADLLVNVISLKAAGFPSLDDFEGVLPWAELMKARVRYQADTVEAEFPKEIAAHNGKTVKLAGFMMPLEPDRKQKRFLLTSNPPSCFFHVPGGPAGAIEVFSDAGIEASWDPVILEGRFETVTRSELGVIYRMTGARAVDQ
jgi:hypothetical protein